MLSNLNSNYKKNIYNRELEFLKKKSLKNRINHCETKTEDLQMPEPKIKMDEIYDKKDEKEELQNLLKELSLNRNTKKKK
jgi:hypothetical protein